MFELMHVLDDTSLSCYITYLSFIQPPINLPEIFSEEFFSNGLSIDPNPLPNLYQVRRTATKRKQIHGFSDCSLAVA